VNITSSIFMASESRVYNRVQVQELRLLLSERPEFYMGSVTILLFILQETKRNLIGLKVPDLGGEQFGS
jgi:hypothetical protein